MPDRTDAIERDIQTHRGLLAEAVSQLAGALSPERVSEAVGRDLQARGGVVAEAAMERAKANPLALLLVGAGMAAMVAGPSKPAARPVYDDGRQSRASVAGARDPLSGEFDRRVAAATEGRPRPDASALRKALNSGLAHLPEPARRRVVEARKAAIAAQEEVERRATAAAREARRLHRRQPWSTAALAFGLGALAGTALPRTEIEDDAMGAQRDALLQEAEFALRDELARMSETGQAAVHDGLDAVTERISRH